MKKKEQEIEKKKKRIEDTGVCLSIQQTTMLGLWTGGERGGGSSQDGVEKARRRQGKKSNKKIQLLLCALFMKEPGYIAADDGSGE